MAVQAPIKEADNKATKGLDRPVSPYSIRGRLGPFSGPRVAQLFHGLLALIFLIAFASLGSQVDLLIGPRGLLPIAPLVEHLSTRTSMGWTDFPTFFWWDSSASAIRGGIALGMFCSVLALCGVAPRLCWLVIVPLYLSYTVACRSFLSFQWDNMLLECGFLAIFLPRDKRAPVIHFLFRFVLFKLYFESALAKWQSHLMDWHDGSAMGFYYETAPLPGGLGWTFHHLPDYWHRIESTLVVGFEFCVAPLVFGTRGMRLFAAMVATAFLIPNILTANYGFFCYLSLVLNVFLLTDGDVVKIARPWKRIWPAWFRRQRAWRRAMWTRLYRRPHARRGRWIGALLVLLLLVPTELGLSLRNGADRFTRPASDCRALSPRECISRADWLEDVLAWSEPWSQAMSPFRLIHVYHLFGHITRERIEPEFQTHDGEKWTAHAMHYKPGPLNRALPLIAPHQPRVDFQLWFYGLSFQRRTPEYVRTLLDRLCHDPEAIEPLFTNKLPKSPLGVRISFYRYSFTTPEERADSGDLWKKEHLHDLPITRCRGVSQSIRLLEMSSPFG